jgi:hypothetical protein
MDEKKNLKNDFNRLRKMNYIIIYQKANSHFSSVLLVESISSESDEIRLSPSQQRERETIRCRPANNEKNHVRHHVKITPLDMPSNLLNFRFK